MAADLIEAEGLVHMVSPTMAEFTLCGDAFDLGSDVDGYAWSKTRRVSVSCPSCSAIIRACQGVKTRVMSGGSDAKAD